MVIYRMSTSGRASVTSTSLSIFVDYLAAFLCHWLCNKEPVHKATIVLVYRF